MKLKEYRKKNGLTQEQIAAVLGIPTKTYQNYEREVREADSEVLCKLADHYGVTLDELVGRSASAAESRVRAEALEQQELIGVFQSLNTDGRALLLRIAHDIEGFMGE